MLNIRMNKEKRMWKFKIIFHRRHINNFVSAVDSWQQFLASVTMVSKHQEALLYYQMMKIILSFMTWKLLYSSNARKINFVSSRGYTRRYFYQRGWEEKRGLKEFETCKFHAVFGVFIKQLWNDQNLFLKNMLRNYFMIVVVFLVCKHKKERKIELCAHRVWSK